MKKIYYTIQNNTTGELYSYEGRTRVYEHELDDVMNWVYGDKDIMTRVRENIAIVRHNGRGYAF